MKYLLFIIFLFNFEIARSQNAIDLKKDTSSFTNLVDFFCRCSEELFDNKKESSEVLSLCDFRVLSAKTTIKKENGYFRSVRNDIFQKVEMEYRLKFPNLLMSDIDTKIHKDVIDSVLVNCMAFKKRKIVNGFGLEEHLMDVKKSFRPIDEFDIGVIIADKVKDFKIESILTDCENTNIFQSNRAKFEELGLYLKQFKGIGVSTYRENQGGNAEKIRVVLVNDITRIAHGGFDLVFNSSEVWKKVISIEFISKENLAKIKLDYPPPPPPAPFIKKN